MFQQAPGGETVAIRMPATASKESKRNNEKKGRRGERFGSREEVGNASGRNKKVHSENVC